MGGLSDKIGALKTASHRIQMDLHPAIRVG